MRTCRQSQPLPAAARPPAQKQRASHRRPIARSRPQNPLPASELLLRPVPALPEPRPRLSRARKQALRQKLTGIRLPLPRLAYQKNQRRAVRRLLNQAAQALQREHPRSVQHLPNNRPVARKRQPLPGVPRLPNNRPDLCSREHPRNVVRQLNSLAGLRSPARQRSAIHLLHHPAGPRKPAHPRSAAPIRSAAQEQGFLDNGPSRGATASDLATALVMPRAPQPVGDMVRLDARRIEDRRDMLVERAQPHQRSDPQSDVSTPSKRSQLARSPYQHRL